jgi:glycosyltransferase involved in cell wall biosynthesis
MRILILTWKDPRHPEAGGAEVVAFEFACRLRALGHEVIWFSRRFPCCSPEETIDGIRVVRKGRLLTTYLHAPRFYWTLRPRPDIVLDMVNTICWQAPLYARGRTIAYVNQLAREVLLHHLPGPLARLAYRLEGLQYLTYRRTPTLVFSEGTKGDLVEVGIPSENVRVFPLGLDRERHVTGGVKSEAPLFVFVGRLVRMKRAALCVEAMQEVVRHHADAQLSILGSGPEAAHLAVLVRDLGLQGSVSLASNDPIFGAGSGDLKVDLMQRAWALLLPSVKEGWGMVVTEAAACGTTSIVTDVTGLREVVRPDVTGLLIPADPTPAELAEAMVRIIEDTALRNSLSKAAIEWAARFDWDRSFDSFYQGLMAAARGLGVDGVAEAPDAVPSR